MPISLQIYKKEKQQQNEANLYSIMFYSQQN